MSLTHARTQCFTFLHFHLGKETQQAKGKSNTRALIEMCSIKVEKWRGIDFHCGVQANRKGWIHKCAGNIAQHNYPMPRASVSQSYFKCQSAGEGDSSLAGDVQEQGSLGGLYASLPVLRPAL